MRNISRCTARAYFSTFVFMTVLDHIGTVGKGLESKIIIKPQFQKKKKERQKEKKRKVGWAAV